MLRFNPITGKVISSQNIGHYLNDITIGCESTKNGKKCFRTATLPYIQGHDISLYCITCFHDRKGKVN